MIRALSATLVLTAGLFKKILKASNYLLQVLCIKVSTLASVMQVHLIGLQTVLEKVLGNNTEIKAVTNMTLFYDIILNICLNYLLIPYMILEVFIFLCQN